MSKTPATAGVLLANVESRASNSTASLNRILERPDIPFGYKFIGGNVGVCGKKITLPHYMAMFVCYAVKVEVFQRRDCKRHAFGERRNAVLNAFVRCEGVQKPVSRAIFDIESAVV